MRHVWLQISQHLPTDFQSLQRGTAGQQWRSWTRGKAPKRIEEVVVERIVDGHVVRGISPPGTRLEARQPVQGALRGVTILPHLSGGADVRTPLKVAYALSDSQQPQAT